MFPGSLFGIISSFIDYSKKNENFVNPTMTNSKFRMIMYILIFILILIFLTWALLYVPWRQLETNDPNNNVYIVLLITGFIFFPIGNIYYIAKKALKIINEKY
mgnify:CR=1 FL=1